MPSPRYRCTWDDVAYLDADYMASWGAFTEGRRDTIDFDDDTLPRLAYEMGKREFSAAYQWCSPSRPPSGDFIRSRVCGPAGRVEVRQLRPRHLGKSTRAAYPSPCAARE